MTNGHNPSGLIVYLVGEGKRNEHENPHVITGSISMMPWFGDKELTHQDALLLAAEVEQPHRVFGTEIKGGHIRHISLSLPKEEGRLPDEKWGMIAEDFMQKMGYIGQEGKADVRWVALHHGLSGENKNDHIHLVVDLVRQDGTRAEIWRDRHRTQTAAREIEREHDLFKVSGITAARWHTPQELEAAKRRGRDEPERDTLERIVRAASVSSQTEDEFVRRLRAEGLLVRGTRKKDDQVQGFSVAMKPPKDEKVIFYGGSVIARDLGLGVLRQRWPQGPEERRDAAAEWEAALKGARPVKVGAERSDPSFTAGQLNTELRMWKEKLTKLPVDDHEGWRQASADLAGAFAAWSRATEDKPGPLAKVSKELGRSAQVSRSQYRPRAHDHGPSMRSAAMLTHLATKDDPRAVLAVFERMKELSALIRDHQAKSKDLVRVRNLNTMAREQLIGLNEVLHAHAGLSTGLPAQGTNQGPRTRPARSQELGKDTTAERTNAPARKGK